MKRIPYFILLVIILTSCGVKQLPTSSFVGMDNPSDLNGRYVNSNRTRYLSNVLFEDYRNSDDTYYRSIDMINLDFPTKDSLTISFTDATGYKTFKYKGKTEGNYFEYYVEKNRLYLPPIFIRHWVSKRRIGKNKNGKLEVHRYHDNLGILLFLSGGDSGTDSTTFEPYNVDSQRQLFTVNINGKWGVQR